MMGRAEMVEPVRAGHMLVALWPCANDDSEPVSSFIIRGQYVPGGNVVIALVTHPLKHN